ncbi:MAG: tRNA (guanosine(37)-N1)-methyltransferase TrmD [Patescibacteria group bacterium]
MRFDILTIFPSIFTSFLNESILKRAQARKLIEIYIHDIRKFAAGRHKTVDDKPYGGGPGMIIKIEPLFKCLKAVRKKNKGKVILLSAKGKIFNQKMAQDLARGKHLILICGRYEGFDERIKKYVDLELSVGQYVLMGGEVPAMTIVESVSRLIPKVLGQKNSTKEESYTKALNYLEYAQYTRPPLFRGAKVPSVLLSGDHKKIKIWRDKSAKIIK